MKRAFASLTQTREECVLSLFTVENGLVVEDNSRCGSQECRCEEFQYDAEARELKITTSGKPEVFRPMYEIDGETLALLTEPENWKRICDGLRVRHLATVSWCKDCGIFG